jgi:hypothetical protein
MWLFAGSSPGFGINLGKLYLYNNGTTYSSPNSVPTDNTFHHYAFVADKNHPYANFYMLIDGDVVYSAMTPTFIGITTLMNSPGYSLNGDSVDEMRFSKVARYELNFSVNK